MPQQLAVGFGRQAFAFDKGVVGDGGTQPLALAQPLLHRLAGGGHPQSRRWFGKRHL
jgi:hypothetical protein